MVPTGRILPGVLAEVLRKAPLSPDKVQFAWRAAVGPLVARHGLVRLDGHGTLHVTASDAHWTRELQESARLILPRVAALLGDGVIRSIEVRERATTQSARSRHA